MTDPARIRIVTLGVQEVGRFARFLETIGSERAAGRIRIA